MADSKSTPEAVVLPDGAVVRLIIDGAEMALPLTARDDRDGGKGRFSSGSAGYHGQVKLPGSAGQYQVGINVTLIGSKGA